MHVTSKAFWLPKAGNAPEEYEDAFWPDKPFEAHTKLVRFAVADGATETSFSSIWARGLTRAYGRGRLGDRSRGKAIARLRAAWHRRVNGKPLPWYAEEKVRMGAFSSLVGLTLTVRPSIDRRHGQWEAMALGDSCLFHVRGVDLLAAFPLDGSEQFNNRPLLLSTNPDSDDSVLGQMAHKQGQWEATDVFYLMTDALACWLLRRQEENAKGLARLAELQTQDRFAEFVHREREELDANGRPRLQNDDVTLVRIEVS